MLRINFFIGDNLHSTIRVNKKCQARDLSERLRYLAEENGCPVRATIGEEPDELGGSIPVGIITGKGISRCSHET